MKNITYLFLLIGLSSINSCQRSNNIDSRFPAPINIEVDFKYHSLKLDTIILNEDGVESSQLGFSGIHRNQDYYFVDSRFCWYYVFDFEGNFKARFLGQGGGPMETTIGRIATCCILPDTSLFLLGYQLDHYIYDKHFEKKKRFILKGDPFAGDITTNWRAYTHEYSNLVCRSHKDKVYFNMYSEHPDFNYIEHLDRYLKKCHHIFEVNIATGEPGKMYAFGYPPVYHKNSFLYVNFSSINYGIDNTGNFYVSYEADSLIYKYDNQFTPIYSFGYSGKNMNMKYIRTDNFEDCQRYYKQERIDKGYYSWIEYIDETNLLIRSYKKGSHAPDDGLQIYSNKTLVADLSVPKGFKIAGYVAPYYYSQVIVDEEKELLIVYRFKLDS